MLFLRTVALHLPTTSARLAKLRGGGEATLTPRNFAKRLMYAVRVAGKYINR
ncbi:hypothetical protein AGMMS50239_15430 [Bacteroidia bacterium]|nr:hypothetical protein AGMMS50239_15430 [Bacteroidia bacterium]